jgi:hypothetical protein
MVYRLDVKFIKHILQNSDIYLSALASKFYANFCPETVYISHVISLRHGEKLQYYCYEQPSVKR